MGSIGFLILIKYKGTHAEMHTKDMRMGIIRSCKIQMIYKGIIPFVLLQLVGLTAIILFPELVMWLPNALLD